MTTITSSTTLSISLTYPTYQNPVVILPGVSISYNGGGRAIDGSTSAEFWTIQNAGAISGQTEYAILLTSGGSINNSSGGVISGYEHGINITGSPGTVANSGIISATSSMGLGIRLKAGGSVTNATDASIIGGFTGVHINGSAGTVVNSGNISSFSTAFGGYGVRLSVGGSVTNSSEGSIVGGIGGIEISERYNGQAGYGAAGTVINYGHIVGTQDGSSPSFGVHIFAGGSVFNGASAVIAGGRDGIYMENVSPGTVVNDGTILAAAWPGAGVLMEQNGYVINASAASLIKGYYGVNLWSGTNTIVNYGTIVGTGTYEPAIKFRGSQNILRDAGTIVGGGDRAVAFYYKGSNLLILDPGAVVDGLVVGGVSASNAIELSSAVAVGTISGIGTQFTDFGSITFDSGAKWFVSGNTSGLDGTISGFAYGDTIQVSGITATGSQYADGVLTLTEASGQVTLTLPGSFTTSDFVVENVVDGVDVTLAPCFGRGTRLRTSRGDMPVERLREGDTVMAHFGDQQIVSASIIWVGTRSIDARRHPLPRMIWPVRICKGTFGVGLPSRDLHLSPDHAIYFDGVLIPVKHLINGTTIIQSPCNDVTYYHIELARHGVVLAEGLSVESYLDTGDRSNFANTNGPVVLHPDFASRIWEAQACAPLVVTGPKLSAAQRRASADFKVRPDALSRKR